MRRHSKKTEQEINLVSGKYLHDFLIVLTFDINGKKTTKVVDFLPLFQLYVKGDNLHYFAPENFKKFIISNGHISWGKNEDVIFSVSSFFSQKKGRIKEDVLFVI
ncbi:MAG TPA: hypothetical protein VFV31_08300 [Chitinophagaceae bacterium]|nr:hypothetical protein [Chitinophagaceae bacterium]